ncbi:MAG: Calx-beta domain-containing protein [Xanthomonadales bacterium]|nr:Calx-beta domain-containing protein [Xanthomonadales bacterium]
MRIGLLLTLVIGVSPWAVSAQTVTMEVNNLAATEAGPAAASITFRRDGDTDSTLVVSVNVLPGSTAETNDYEDNNQGSFVFLNRVNIESGEEAFTLLITPTADNRVEMQETLTFELADSTAYTIGSPDPLTVTIDDDPPVVEVGPADGDTANLTAIEGGMPARLDFTRTGGDLTTALLFNIDIDASSTASGADYEDNTAGEFEFLNRVTIPADESLLRLEITATPDNLAEGEETLDVRLVGDTYMNGPNDQVLVILADDAPRVSLSVINDLTSEDGPPAVIQFVRSGGQIDQDLRVNTTLEASSTAGDRDFSDNLAGTFLVLNYVTIPSGDLTFNLELTGVQDGLIEATEVLDVALADGDYLISEPSMASITVLDTLIFTSSFEGTGTPDKCARLEDGGKYWPGGDSPGDLVWRPCAANANLDMATGQCVTDPSLQKLNPVTFVTLFNRGVLADNHGYRWRLATAEEKLAAGVTGNGCLVRSRYLQGD